MSEYSGIRGTRVKYLASDPTLNTSTEGQVWYNSTSGTLKSLVQIKAFSAGANYPTSVFGQVGGAGTQTAGLAFGGRRPGGPTNDYDITNEYNGYSWTAAPDLGTGRYGINSCGTQTAALGAGGYRWPTPPTGLQTTVEEYDGSSWTAGTALPTGISSAAMNGLQTAALLSGGNATRTEVLSYDGSTWTSEPALNAGRRSLRGAGTTTNAIVFGGVNPLTPIIYSNTESFNGTSWTEVNNMNTPIYDMNVMSSSSSHVASNSGYNGTATTNITEEWDGTNWTTAPTSSVTHRGGAGFGTATAGVSAVGGSSPYTATEEYVSSIDAYSPSIATAWASGVNMATARRDLAGFGTQNSAVGTAGYGGAGYTTTTEEYDGSSWSAGTAYPGAVASMGSTGTLTAGLVFGASGPGTPNTATYEYDGSTWTVSGSLGTGRYDMGGAGTQTAALSYGGSVTTNVESYNGTAWTSTTALNTARRAPASVGTQTAALAAGGKFSPTPTDITANVEEWNGSSWTEVNNLPAPTFLMGSAGIQTDALVFGGSQGAPRLATTSGYDGTNWSAKPNMATARDRMGSGQNASPSTSAIAFAGEAPPLTAATEEFTGGSPITPTGVQASTLTTS